MYPSSNSEPTQMSQRRLCGDSWLPGTQTKLRQLAGPATHTHLVFLQLLVSEHSLLAAHAGDHSLESTGTEITGGSSGAPRHIVSEQMSLPWLSPAHPSSHPNLSEAQVTVWLSGQPFECVPR